VIRVDLRTSRGEILESLPAHPNFDPVLAGVDRSVFPMLGHLDPYGDTVLNRMQVETLLGEISLVRSRGGLISDSFGDSLVDICKKCLSRPHRFVWFIGD
jgi:hypothetical protein